MSQKPLPLQAALSPILIPFSRINSVTEKTGNDKNGRPYRFCKILGVCPSLDKFRVKANIQLSEFYTTLPAFSKFEGQKDVVVLAYVSISGQWNDTASLVATHAFDSNEDGEVLDLDALEAAKQSVVDSF